jgi:hypothetical protein
MIDVLTTELAKEMAKKMDLNVWVNLSRLNKCFMCKFKESLFVEHEDIKGAKILNGKYIFHLYETHGLPPMSVVNMIADKLYKDEESKQKMREMYKGYDKF